ncbi:hypothetical protein B0H10DRAFT_701002 [Mycena sp. CBHHK59/15]|nr:hypothetical protein B0H10DRAFT_701002 [Mycena sp. CBHHK59/15]
MSSPKSFRSRMGGVMRRTSSVLAIARPTTPTPSTPPAEDSRRSSISKSQEGRKSTTSLTLSGATPPAPEPAAESQPPAEPETTGDTPTLAAAEDSPAPQTNGTPKAVKRLLPIAVQYQQYPSPIAESPAREAAATTEDGTGASGPSPLGQASEAVPIAQDQVASVPAEPEALAVSAPQASEGAEVPRVPVSEAEQEQEAPPATAVEEAYVHPALILDSSNPGAFTDEPNEMHKEPHPEPTERATEEAPRPVAAVEPVAAQEYAYFDLVRPVGPAVHDVALASPGSGRETVVAEEQAHISPYPYDMQPAQSQPEPEPEPVPAVAPEPVPAADPVPLAAEQSGAANTDVPRPMQWDDASGWDSGAVFMPISATLPATT